MREKGKNKEKWANKKEQCLASLQHSGFQSIFTSMIANTSRESLQGMFVLALSLYHVVVTSSGFRIRHMWFMIPFLLFPSVWPWINYIMSLSVRFLLWKMGIRVTALQTVHTNGCMHMVFLNESQSLILLVIIATAI